MVPEHSAVLTAYSNYGLHADHMGMARFSSLEDPNYVRVANEIWRWARQSSKAKALEKKTLGPLSNSAVNEDSAPITVVDVKETRRQDIFPIGALT